MLGEEDNVIGKSINIGSNTEYSILETFELIKKIMKSNVEYKTDQSRIRPSGSEVTRLVCDNSVIKSYGYKPKFSFEQGLIETINWFSDDENLKKYKTNLYNV